MKPAVANSFVLSCSAVACVLLLLCHCAVQIQAGLIATVTAPCGVVQGLKHTDEDSKEMYLTFKGVPYAKPPVGELRFAKPQALPPTDDIIDATRDRRIVCPHPSQLTAGESDFTEDCLVLNVMAKDQGGKPLTYKKVLVFIHGGGFSLGTSYFYDPKSFVLSQDVIVVTINYRLGALGFLSTDNEVSPGNYGLWDQTMALRWVKDNIRAFGGDPDDVTIAGESAGGASVGYHMISPHAKGLFTKAYPQSGTATSVFALSSVAQSLTLKLAKGSGCWDKDVNLKLNVEESKAVIQCLRKLPVSALSDFLLFPISQIPFVPVMDGDFIPDTPANLIKDDAYLESIGFFDRSYVVGINNFEEGFMDKILKMDESIIFMNKDKTAEEKVSIWQGFLADTNRRLTTARVGEKGALDRVVNAVVDFYDRRFANDTRVTNEIISDLSFLVPSYDFINAAARKKSCDVYLFHFDHFPDFVRGPGRGTSHALDLLYWFDIELSDMEQFALIQLEGKVMSEEELKVKSLFSSVIGNFVRTGDPGKGLSSGWPRYDTKNSYYLNFNLDPWVSNFLGKDKQDFWFQTVPELLGKKHTHSEL